MNIEEIRKSQSKIIVIGNHPGIIQSMLDYDFLIGHTTPSIIGIVATGRKFVRFFFGKREVLLPVYSALSQVSQNVKKDVNTVLNVSSGRRVLTSMVEAIDTFPSMKIGTIFAEGVPEKHSIDLFEYAKDKNVTIIGPSSVGLVVPGSLKLGAIGGVSLKQITS